jgi:type I restriction enzyme S subunit
MTWRRVQFKDFVTLQRGFDLPEAELQDGDVPVLGSNCIIGFHNQAKVQPPGVITGRSGTLGEVQFVNDPYWPHNTALWVRDFKGNVPRFVYYKLQTLQLDKFSSGASVPTLNRNNLDNIPVELPSGCEQEKIADVLWVYDELIENNRWRMRLLEEAARLLYREWFVRFRFPGHERTRILDGIPQGWDKWPISAFGEVITGKTPSTRRSENYDGDIPFIKTPDMHGRVFVTATETTLTEEGANTQRGKFVPPSTPLVSCIGTIGVVALTATRSQFNQQINAVVPSRDYYRYFCFFSFRDLKERMQAIGGGATMGNVNKTKFEGLEILSPTDSLLREFDDFCTPVFQQIKMLQIQSDKLRAARDLLLPRLMSGEISVTDPR